MAYELTQKEYRSLKTKLAKALNEKSSEKIIVECRRAFSVFEQKGFPDDWSRWQRAMDDAVFAQNLSSKKWF
jgi:hypothetical protein